MSQNAIIYQKKKSHAGLIILIIILIIIALPIGLAYALFYDTSSKEVTPVEGVTSQVYLDNYKENVVAKSLNDTSEGKISIVMNENEVNNLLYYALKENLSGALANFINKGYLDVTDNYTFYIDASTPFFPWFKTRLALVAEVNEINTPSKGIEIHFTDAKVGRIGGLFSIVDKFVTQDMMQNIFSGSGLSFKVDWTKKTVTYTLDDLLNDMGFNSSGSSDNIFYEMVNILLVDAKNQIGLDFYKNKGFTVDFDLSSAHDASFVPAASFNKTIAKLRSEFANTENLTVDQVTNRFASAMVEENEKPAAGKEITDCLEDNSDAVSKTTYVTETEFNDYLRGSDLVGKVYPFIAKDLTTKANTINFITISDFMCDLKDDNSVTFIVNINLNGYDTQLVAEATIADAISQDGHGKLVLNFTINDINYGSAISLWDTENDKPKQFVNDLIEQGFSFDGSSSSIKINGKNIVIEIDNAMYNLGNAITTSEDRMTVQVFVPQFYSGLVDPNLFTEFVNPKDGDMYFNKTSKHYWVHEGGAWVDKAQLLSGLTAPDNALGNNNDMYLNNSNLHFYVKESGTWNDTGLITSEEWLSNPNNTIYILILNAAGFIGA